MAVVSRELATLTDRRRKKPEPYKHDQAGYSTEIETL
jgi:hypothetical protein